MSGQVHRAFVMADLSGFTALTEAHGAERAAALVDRYAALTRAALAPGAWLVERVGDAVLLAALDAEAAVATAVALDRAVITEPDFPLVRVGLHAGPVLERGGSYFGTTLNLTARVASHARGGEMLCTAAVAGAVRAAGVTFTALGAVRFRNVLEPVELFRIVAAGPAASAWPIDPVCRMHVEPEHAAACLIRGDTRVYFCSMDCARAFTAHPERYADG